MNWPSPKDFNDAVRNPATAFVDPDLAAGDAVVGTDGRLERHPGDTSTVYQVCAEDGRSWAVKCYSRPHDQRAARLAAVRDALAGSAPSFAVGFNYLEEGVRAGGRAWPVLKMDWVEGLPLNRVARERADSPAVIDRLFKQWVQLARELRTAGIAHGDLQHANVLLVPGKWPGAYALKLIDYDAVYLPELANAPAYEAGHPNYQHPDRTERSYSPDLDRFPLLVVATALKALSVLGSSLWKRYGTDNNLLFTAEDFRTPAASPLMRALWQSDNPALRALVGKLALACGQPIAQTPWLDELAPDGADAKLTPEESAAAAAALGFGPVAAVPVAAAFTLDDEPKPAPILVAAFTLDDEPPPAPVRRAPAARPATGEPLTPVPVLASDEDDDEEDSRPRPQQQQQARGFPLLAAAVVAGLLLVTGGVLAGFLITRANTPDETVQPRPEEPAPKPEPPKPDLPGPVPVPKPEPKPPEPPPFAGPPGFHRLWAKQIADERVNVKPYITTDGQTVYVGLNTQISAFDTKTGEPRPALRGAVPTVTIHLWSLDRGRVAAFGFPQKAPGFWDAKTGEQLASPLARDPLAPPPPGVHEVAVECQLSPDGRFVFAGYQAPFRGPGPGPAPYRVTEVATGKVVAQGDWTFGTARFTADGSRMLMTETNGRVRWLKTSTGEVEIEWAFQPNALPRMIGGMSDDGSLFVYHGRPAALPLDNYLMDGKTGQVLRRLGITFGPDRSVLSADGRWLVGVGTEPPQFRQYFAIIADARTGEVFVRTPLEGGMNDFQRVGFTPDGKAFALHHRGNHEIAVYELRGTVPAVQSAPIPPPLSLIPDRAPPLGAAVGIPPPPPPPVPAPRPGLPDAPALKARWTVVADVRPTSNQLPQAPLFAKDGRTVILTGGQSGTVHTFDAKTGAAGAVYEGHKGPGGVHWVLPFGTDRAVSVGFDGKQATWDTKTGKQVDAMKFPDLPPMPPPQRGHAGITYSVSPSGRYTVAARRESVRPVVPGPLRVLDTTTGKEVLSAGWNGGRVAFTADESRVFVLDGLGKAARYKLPSGEADGEWRTGEGVRAESARVLGMTADGRTILYHGPLADQPVGVYLVDGKTGQVVRKLNSAAPYQVSFSALSPDGRYLAMGVIDFNGGFVWHTDIFEVATWRLVGRVSPPEKSTKEPAQVSFTADGKALGVFFPTAKELSLFPLPGE